MAISTQVNNDLYKRALSDAEKKRLAQIAQTQGAGAASSLALQMANSQNTTTTPPITGGATTPTNTGGATGGSAQAQAAQAQAAQARAAEARQQAQAQQERNRIMTSGTVQERNALLQRESMQRNIEMAQRSGNTQAAAQMQQAMEAQERARILSSGNQQQINQYLIEQSRKQAQQQNPYQAAVAAATPAGNAANAGHGLSNAPTINGNYIWYGWMGDNNMTTMTDEDKANWNTAMAGWQKGDYSAFNDNFQKAGNWSSYVDDKGNVNGMLRYVGDGIGGYVPVNGGQLLQNGFSGDMGNYAFYGPDGSVYTADSSGRLTKAGTWTADYDQVMKSGYYYNNPDRYFVGKDGKYYTYGGVPDDKLEEWGYVRRSDGIFYEPDTIARNNALKNGDITPEQLALAQAAASRNAGNIPGGIVPGGSSSGGSVSGGGSYTPTPAPSSGGNTPTGATTPSGGSVPSGGTGATGYTPYQLTLDQFDYGTAPEWEGTEYEQKRDAALEAAQNMRWDGSEYQTERDRLLEEAMRPYEGSPYDQQRDEALARYGEEWQGSEYQQKRDDALQRAENMRWNYAPNTDPVWQALQKQYRREGQRATQDAMGQAAARTGGIPSSYAMTAASQAGDYYAAQLSDRIPQVYQDSYQRYLQEFQKQLGISDQYQGFDDREYSRWADQQGKNLDLADRYNQYGRQDYDQYRDRVSQQLSGADRYNGYDQTEYQRYLDEYGQQLDAADRYQGYGAQEYDRYRDRLGQWNTDRNFQYGLNRDAVEDARYADETAYSRNYRAQRDAVEDQRYDQQWAQQLREYADAQGWKQAEWQQYLREYGDQLSEKERQWAYQMARDAVEDNRWERQYADSRGDTAYERALRENELAYDRAWNEDERDYERGWDTTKWNQALREYDDEQAQQAWNNDYKLSGRNSGGSGGGYSGGGSGGGKSSDTPAPASGGAQYDASGRRTGTWQDSDGYTYNGYHPDGQWKSQGYDAAWSSIQALAKSEASKETVLTRIRSLVAQDRITDYEAEMMLVNLGYRTRSAGTGRNSIGPNNVQMVQ